MAPRDSERRANLIKLGAKEKEGGEKGQARKSEGKHCDVHSHLQMFVLHLLGPDLMFAKHDKHYPSRSGQTSLATAVANITKPVTKIHSGPSR